jgi:hypothetical protein
VGHNFKNMILRILLTWLVIIIIETIHGIFRRLFLVPFIGEHLSNQIGVFTGSALILTVVWFLYKWLNIKDHLNQIFAGLIWCFLTFCFEIGLGYGFGYSLDEMLSQYNFIKGGFMLIGMAVYFFPCVSFRN